MMSSNESGGFSFGIVFTGLIITGVLIYPYYNPRRARIETLLMKLKDYQRGYITFPNANAPRQIIREITELAQQDSPDDNLADALAQHYGIDMRDS